MKIKSSTIIKALLFTFVVCIFCSILCFIPNSLKANTAYATEGISESSAVASGACGTELIWELTDDGTLRIEGEGAMSTYSNGTAPWYSYADNITAIIISDTVTSISDSAFNGCGSLKEMTLPFVGETRAASGSKGLFGYIFGESSYSGGKKIEQYYNGNSNSYRKYYYIPGGLEKVTITDADKLSYGAFYNCSMIKEINLNDSITSIEDYAFA